MNTLAFFKHRVPEEVSLALDLFIEEKRAAAQDMFIWWASDNVRDDVLGHHVVFSVKNHEHFVSVWNQDLANGVKSCGYDLSCSCIVSEVVHEDNFSFSEFCYYYFGSVWNELHVCEIELSKVVDACDVLPL